VSGPSDPVIRTRAEIVHGPLASSVGSCLGGLRRGKSCSVNADCPGSSCSIQRFDYYPVAESGVTDLAQNCFFPACGSDPLRPYCCSNVACAKSCAVGTGGAYACPP